MEIYHFNKVSGEYINSGTADKDPLNEEGWLIPANATTTAPPVTQSGQVAVFNGVAWSVEEDHRGKLFFHHSGKEVTITAIGPIPAGLTTTAPAPTKEQLAASLASRRYAAETGGTAIGGIAVATDRDTQSKLIAARIKAKEDAAYTVNWKGLNGFILMDAETIILIADGVQEHVQACFDKEAELFAQIEAALDPTTVDIETGWPS